MLQSLFRPVLRPIMMGVMAVTGSRRAWSPLALWPTGTEPGMWISPRTLTSEWQDYTGTTPVSIPGTVADTSNPVGLALDIRAGATVLTDPGNHMLQSTSAARPLMSARVNTLTYTEDFANSVWVIDVTGDGTLTKTLSQTDPLGNATAVRLLVSSITIGGIGFRYSTGLATEQVIRSAYIKSNTGVGYSMYLGDTTITLIADTEWHRYDVSEAMFSWGFRVQFASSADITLAFPQRELGTTATTYQRVTTDSDYDGDPAKFPYYLKFDGVDDGMATASFAAGTLINGMDCMIPVRRDSGANCVAGLYNGIADATKFFGMAESGSGSGCVGSGAGTPTVWVDNTQLTGGTAVTRGTLHTALTAGNVHILEFRNLDLSAWTATGFGLYTSYVFPGARGDIMLFESTASTEDKDAARQYLADKYGVTLA